MDLELTGEQLWLTESIEQLLAQSDPNQIWPALIEFGALAIASGGDGLGAVELVLVGRALGQSLATVPLIDTVAAGYATRPAASLEHQALAAVHAGEDALSLCLLEPGTGWELARCATSVTGRNGAASLIEGRKAAVHDAAAGALLVLYNDGDERRLALIDREAPAVKITPTLLADMYVKQTSAWSTVLFAAAALEDGIEDASRTASIARAYASRATLDVAHGALQVFGGIAFTAEHCAHRFLRRILVRNGQFGDAQHHEWTIGRELAAATRTEELVV